MSEEQNTPQSFDIPEEISYTLKKFGIAVPIWDREITKAEIQYFLDRWLFLQILSSNKVDQFDDVKRERAKSNWTILNYGDAMAASPGEFLFGGGDFTIKPIKDEQDDDDGDAGGGDIVNPGKGTIWRQAYDTVADMLALASRLGWDGVHVVDGHPLMKFAAWMHALDNGLMCTGFEPSERDQERRERIRRSEIEDAKRFTTSIRSL